MNLLYFSITITLTLIAVGIWMVECIDFLYFMDNTYLVIFFSIIIGSTIFFQHRATHANSLNGPMHIISSYIENSINESDDTTKEDIDKILDKTLSNKLKKAEVYSYTNKKSQAKFITVDIKIGKILYSNFKYEFLINLKTNEITDPIKGKDPQSKS